MKWIGERISVKEQKTKTTVVIYPEKKPMVTGLMGAWLAMWFAIGISCVWYYFIAQFIQQEKIILFIFMTFWTYYAIRVLRSFFWMMWGNEYFKIDETAFTSKKSIRGFGKAVPYYLENIKKMSISIPKENSLQAVWESSPWVKGGERLEFEYLGKNIRFARKLNEKDSKLLFQLITKRIEEQLKQKMKNMDKYD